MIRVLPFLMALALSTGAAAQTEPQWLRYPAISPDGSTIVFTYKGDLYRVPVAGGAAVPLTTHNAHDYMPVWSRDGRQIAFASDRFGNFDVYVMPAEGGAARRLTFHSADELPYSFATDGAGVIFGAARLDAATNRLFPTGSQPELYQVPVAGGRVAQLLTTPAEEVSLSRDGRFLLYQDRKGGENAWRKHHRSAVARDIWLHDVRAGTHRRVTSFAGEDRSPVLDGDSVFFYLSEESGSFNVHRMKVAGGASEKLTSFTGSPVRFLSRAANGTLAFGYDGRIYTMRPGSAAQPVPVAIAADARANAENVVTIGGNAREMSVAPNGKEVAFVFRGDVFVANVDGGTTKQITRTPENETGVMFSPDSKALLYASERGGRWGVYEARRAREGEPYFYAATIVRETPLIVNDRQNFQPAYSPDGKEIAFIESFNRLRIYNVASKQTRTLLTEKELFSTGPGTQFEWSPDGKWLLFDYAVPGLAPGEVGLVRADGSQPAINLTRSGFSDFDASWILGGKAMLWRSNRDGMRGLSQAGGTQTDAYAMFFTRDAFERFQLSKEDAALAKELDTKTSKAAGDSAKKAKTPVEIDLDGIENRKARLTIHSSSMGSALVTPDGETLYYLARFERGMNLWSTNLRTRETKMVLPLNANGAFMAWDSAQKNIFLLADGSISKVEPGSAKRETVTLRGEMMVDAEAERAAMFDRVWRRTRDTYYTAGYHGIDWVALRPQFEKYLPHVGNHYEFAELLSEMLGELNVSHSGARYSAFGPTNDATASLGIFFDYAHRGTGIRITEVIRGGPLDKAGMNVRPGMIIEAIDGNEVAPDVDYVRMLNRKAGQNVLLTVRDGGSTREVVVKPITLGEEGGLLYNRWVRLNQEEVEKRSNGQLGYVHVPGMNDGAYRSAFDEIMGKFADRKGVVVDARWNGGGDLVADLAMFLTGKRFFDYTTDTRSSGFEPHFRWTKPSISLVNEAAYSDGHCYAWTYKALGIGQLVGMPVPGTCTFAGWEMLTDGLRWGVPGVGVKDVSTGRYLENWETEPDIRVMNEYDVVNRGRDQQLEAAVEALLRSVR